MSGTLTPTNMYKDLLGFSEVLQKEYKSPFPKKNKISIVVPQTTTKFSLRSEKQYKNIAKICSNIIKFIPGNSAIFFPSYQLRDYVYAFFSENCERKIFLEKPGLAKKEKKDLLLKFKKIKKAVLLGAASGSFGEGIDLPNVLKCVIVVGLPLQVPDLETRELIRYYDLKFGKGWDYGYTLPAVTKALQNAGRCIRSETDKGIIIFLDERYSWKNYYRCFPIGWDVKITNKYLDEINAFFRE